MSDGTQPINQSSETSPTTPAAVSQVDDVLRHHCEIAAALRRATADVPRASQRFLTDLANRFEAHRTPQQVLADPAAVHLLAPLAPHAAALPDQPHRIEAAVMNAEQRFRQHASQRRGFSIGLTYPLVVVVGLVVLVLFYLAYIVPMFDQMYTEFEVELPAPTRLVILLSRWLLAWGWLILTVILAVVVPLVAVTIGWLRRRSARREAVAGWATHLAGLFRLDVPYPEALRIASSPSRLSWLRAFVQTQLASSPQDFAAPTLGGRPLAMVSYALSQPTPAERSEWLDEVAEMYLERGHYRRGAYLAWMAPAMFCLTGATIGLIVISIFMPLVSLISGLA